MKAVELKPDIYWVGVIDWAVRDFHGYVTPKGTTYNNYLILDEDITLVDAVKHDFVDITLDNIRSITNPSRIVNIVVNHIEPDHASGLGEIMELAPEATIHITKKGKEGLDRHFDTSKWRFRIVKTGDTLKTGKYTLTFIETPMLHWPDSMMSYVKEVRLLISQDVFGQHLASSARFDDEYATCASMAELEDATIDYYANILMPFGKLIISKTEEIKRLGIEIDMIAPDHGVIWRSNPEKVLNLYIGMASGKADLRVVIIYDTMWHSTERMIPPISHGIRQEGVDCKVVKLRATPMSVAIKEFWRARGCLVGSPTLNNLLYPSVAEFLTHLKGLRPKNRIVGAFGSYGWGGGAVRAAYDEFKQMGLELYEPGMQIQYKPTMDDEEGCFEFGREFAKRVKEYNSGF